MTHMLKPLVRTHTSKVAQELLCLCKATGSHISIHNQQLISYIYTTHTNSYLESFTQALLNYFAYIHVLIPIPGMNDTATNKTIHLSHINLCN